MITRLDEFLNNDNEYLSFLEWLEEEYSVNDLLLKYILSCYNLNISII